MPPHLFTAIRVLFIGIWFYWGLTSQMTGPPVPASTWLVAFVWGAVAVRFWISRRYTASDRTAPWYRPSWLANPFSFEQPFQFFHLAGVSFVAHALATLLGARPSVGTASVSAVRGATGAAAFGGRVRRRRSARRLLDGLESPRAVRRFRAGAYRAFVTDSSSRRRIDTQARGIGGGHPPLVRGVRGSIMRLTSPRVASAVFGICVLSATVVASAADASAAEEPRERPTSVEDYAANCGRGDWLPCRVPVHALLAKGALFSGRKVEIRGVLVARGDRFLLYASCDAVWVDPESTIDVDVPVTDANARPFLTARGPVIVAGTYASRYRRPRSAAEGIQLDAGSLPRSEQFGDGRITAVTTARLIETPAQVAANDAAIQRAQAAKDSEAERRINRGRNFSVLRPPVTANAALGIECAGDRVP